MLKKKKKEEEKKYKEKKKKTKKTKVNTCVRVNKYRAVIYIESEKVDQTYSLHSGLYFFHFFCILRLQAATSKNNIMTTTTTNVIRIGTASF